MFRQRGILWILFLQCELTTEARNLTAAGGHIFSHKLHQYLAKNQLKIMTNLEFL